jgi:hypothetical protein
MTDKSGKASEPVGSVDCLLCLTSVSLEQRVLPITSIGYVIKVKVK